MYEEVIKIDEILRKSVFSHLSFIYNDLVKKKVEENYKTGKVEEYPLCKRICSSKYEDLKALYPEEMEYLDKLYFPIFKKHIDDYAFNNSLKEPIFNDISEFKSFIDKIKSSDGSIISDKPFNVVNNALNRYGTELYGDKLFGTCKSYYFKYDNFLKAKDLISEEIELLIGESDDDINWNAVNSIKMKCSYLLNVEKGNYCV